MTALRRRLQTRSARHDHRARSDRGSLVLEFAVLAPGMVLIISLLIVTGRVALAGQSVAQAADEAARAASLARTQSEAARAAGDTSTASLRQQSLQCVSSSVTVDTSGYARPAGTAASVAATVTCVVRLSDVAIPGLPGSHTVTATASSPLDTYRER